MIQFIWQPPRPLTRIQRLVRMIESWWGRDIRRVQATGLISYFKEYGELNPFIQN